MDSQDISKEQLRRWYIIEKRGTREIGKLLGLSQPWARKRLVENGIQLRSYKENKMPVPKGSHLTEAHRRAIGKAQTGKIGVRGAANPKWRQQEVPCSYCGKKLLKKQTHMRFREHFCNGQCNGKWKAKHFIGEGHPQYSKVKVNCAYCGKEIARMPSVFKHTKNFFCSYGCNGKWKSENLVGAKIYNWKGGYDPYYGPDWRVQRRKAWERDLYACQRCGITKSETRRNPDVHHKKPWRLFGLKNHLEANRLSNLICYCNKCHKIVEEGK